MNTKCTKDREARHPSLERSFPDFLRDPFESFVPFVLKEFSRP